MNQEQEIRAKALEIAVTLFTALPDNERRGLMETFKEQTAEEVIAIIAGRFARYIGLPPSGASPT
jgi:hypothetical protein